MSSTLTQMLKLAYPAEAPTDAHCEAMGHLAAKADLTRTKRLLARRRLRLSFGGLSFAAAATAVFVLEPRIAFAMLLNKVHARIDGQTSVHYTVWTIRADGSRIVSQEIWHQGAADRVELGGGRQVQISRGLSRWVYDVAAKTVLAYKDPPGTRRFGSFKGADLLHELDSSSWLDRVQTADAGDQIVTSVIPRNERTRIRLWVDKSSDLPTRMEIQSPRGAGWTTVQEGTFEFSSTPGLGDRMTELPHGISVIDAKLARTQLQAKWQKPLFAYGSTRIYDVEANERGDIFVIYAGDSIRLESDRASYTSSMFSDEFQPTLHWHNSDRVEGFTSGNGDLRGKIFTPVRFGSWRPMHLRITCVHPSSNRFTPDEGEKIIGENGQTYYTWTVEEMARAMDKHEKTAPDRDKRTFNMQIAGPNCAIFPTYMPLVPMGIQSVADLDEIEAGARARYFKDRGLSADAEREIRAEIRAFDLKCVEIGSPGVQPQAYFDLYEVLAAQGKRDEAIAALKKVPDQMLYKNDDLQRRLDEAYAKEGLR